VEAGILEVGAPYIFPPEELFSLCLLVIRPPSGEPLGGIGMAFADYALRYYRESTLLRDNEKGSKWAYRLSSKLSPSTTLEEEIYRMRCKMEQTACREQSLTAPEVIELSTKLDRMLNDYMNARPRA
jgi:hypothetical protein